LDRAQAVGMAGWMPLPMHQGVTDRLREQIAAVKDHPALAVWEGPDEVVWNFTAYSGLYRDMKVHDRPGAWWEQTPGAVAYAKKQAAEIIPNIRESVALIRETDKRNLPIWFNEAHRSDAYYVREYLNGVDVTGCDLYPVNDSTREIAKIGDAVQRWNAVGRGIPVWMVLQAFSWSELERPDPRGPAYPSFAESRFMAYETLVHGGEGILYWGSHYLTSDAMREAVYAVTSELAALQPFLIAGEQEKAQAVLVEEPSIEPRRGVAKAVRRNGKDWLVVLVNDDEEAHMGVEVTGLGAADGTELVLLYGDETVTISGGGFMTRLQPLEVKVFATSKTFETQRLQGRDYAGE
ncbi:MAG: hypothetical protein KJ052_08105, partial [Candidatus Hydrogenedentes bacterium]|nr:hypothetical protein [Candidatus Hydrogenedentota bacterium]